MSILRAQFLKFLPLTLLIVALSFGLTTFRPVKAAPPDKPAVVINQTAEKAGVTLEKIASHENVPLGQVVSYTITLKNGGDRPIEATLTDALPAGLLALQHQPISATVGVITTTDNTLVWSGRLAPGDSAAIIYDAIPPSHSAIDQKVSNMARLQFGETTLEAGATITTQKADPGIWGIFVNFLALILIWTNDWLAKIGVPFSFGFAIIVFTVAVRLATYPLNAQQIKSSKAMQELQPKMKELQEKYKNDKEKLAQEQMNLYKEHGVNPLGGCLPMLVQMPVWFALYQSLMQLSKEGLLNQGFLWIPSLAGPIYGNGSSGGFLPPWLYPFVNGAPPLGWLDTLAYLVLPVLLVVSQMYMQNMMTPPSTDPQQASMQSAMKIMPIMFGYFALVVPSGLSLYWFTSNLLAMGQQYFQNRSQAAPTAGKVPAKAPMPTTLESDDPDLNDADLANAGGNTQSQNAKSKRKRRRK